MTDSRLRELASEWRRNAEIHLDNAARARASGNWPRAEASEALADSNTQKADQIDALLRTEGAEPVAALPSDLERMRQNSRAELARRGYQPNELQVKFREGFWDKSLAELAIVDALVEQGGIAAWPGDGVGCVAQMIEAQANRAALPSTAPGVDLDAIKAREAAATKGPWRIEHDSDDEGAVEFPCFLVGPRRASAVIAPGSDFEKRYGHRISEVCDLGEDDAQFIAHARTDIPALIAEVERLRAVARTVEMLSDANELRALQSAIEDTKAGRVRTLAEIDAERAEGAARMTDGTKEYSDAQNKGLTRRIDATSERGMGAGAPDPESRMVDSGQGRVGGIKGQGASHQAGLAEAAGAPAQEPEESVERTLKSIATMLGWGNVPPRETLERDIAALKARASSTGRSSQPSPNETSQEPR